MASFFVATGEEAAMSMVSRCTPSRMPDARSLGAGEGAAASRPLRSQSRVAESRIDAKA